VTTSGHSFTATRNDPGFLAALNAHQDLCWTCNDAVLCLDRQTLERPVWFCEQFDDYVPVTRRFAPRPTRVQTEVTNNVKGICVNCDERQYCGRGQSAEAIWFCEQYA